MTIPAQLLDLPIPERKPGQVLVKTVSIGERGRLRRCVYPAT